MPTPREIFDTIGLAKVFSTLDLTSGYHQIPLRREIDIRHKYRELMNLQRTNYINVKFLSFGLKNVPFEFQRVINRMHVGVPFVKCYVNDIVIDILTRLTSDEWKS